MGKRYKNETKKKANGVVYTPSSMADYVADEMLKYGAESLVNETITILDPAVGEGELLNSLISKLLARGKKIIACGYETDPNVARDTQENLKSRFPDVEITIKNEDFLDAISEKRVNKFDFVIANPPYVRTQILGSDKAQEIAEKLKLTGRIDIYYAFLIYTKDVLNDNGIAGYITSNKFMTIKAGNTVRQYMLTNYTMHQITDLGDTKLFNASVLPCIMIFSKGKTVNSENVNFTSVYEQIDESNSEKIDNIFDAIHKVGTFQLPNGHQYKFQQGKLKSTDTNALWTLESSENKKWLDTVLSNTSMTFSDIGKIRVGIKTTADKVFIGDDWTGDKADLEWLRPLITHRNAGQIIGNNKSNWQVLYTHTIKDGKKVVRNLENYPKTKKYLLEHYNELAGRSYVAKAHRKWYEIWVPQNPASWEHRKIVFRDISKEPEFWLDESGKIVNGDCYWIDINSDVPEDIVYLALAVANSEFIEQYYDIRFNTKLYSGKRRYQAQYVEQFPIPNYNTEYAQKAIKIIKKIIAEDGINNSDYKKKLNELVNKMFYQNIEKERA